MALDKPEHKTWWYWASWPFLGLAYLLLLPYGLIIGRSPSDQGKMQWTSEWYQALEDWIDDPIDWLKYMLFGIGQAP